MKKSDLIVESLSCIHSIFVDLRVSGRVCRTYRSNMFLIRVPAWISLEKTLQVSEFLLHSRGDLAGGKRFCYPIRSCPKNIYIYIFLSEVLIYIYIYIQLYVNENGCSNYGAFRILVRKPSNT